MLNPLKAALVVLGGTVVATVLSRPVSAIQDPAPDDALAAQRIAADHELQLVAQAGKASADLRIAVVVRGPRTKVYLWARSDEVIPMLRVEAPAARAVVHDGAFATVELERDTELVLTVTAPAAAGVRVGVREVPESDETLRVAEAARRMLGEARARLQQRDQAAAHRKLRAATEHLDTAAGALHSAAIAAVFTDVTQTCFLHGDLATARECATRALAFHERALPPEHVEVLAARRNLAAIIAALGDLATARRLDEEVIAVLERNYPDDHRELQRARWNLAINLAELGDLGTARSLQQRVVETLERTLPPEHEEVQLARMNLAATTARLGDHAGARSLLVSALEVLARTLPAQDPRLQKTRLNAAAMLRRVGDLDTAQALVDAAYGELAATVPEDHPDLQFARHTRAVMLRTRGDLTGARELQEEVIALFQRSLSEEHPSALRTQEELALTLGLLGEAGAAHERLARVLAVRTRCLPPEHLDLGLTRCRLAWAQVAAGETGGLAELLAAIGTAAQARVLLGAGTAGLRPLLEIAAGTDADAGAVLSLARRLPAGDANRARLDKIACALIETRRGVIALGCQVARLARSGAHAAEVARLQGEAATAATALARAVRTGLKPAQLLAACRTRDAAQERLQAALTIAAGGRLLEQVSPERIQAALAKGEAAVGYCRYSNGEPNATQLGGVVGSLHYLAFVVTAEGTCTRVELGKASEIEAAIRRWREAVLSGADQRAASVRQEAASLRQLVLDPVRAAAPAASRLFVALDGALHDLIVDALPEGDGLVGDNLEIVHVLSFRDLGSNLVPGGEPTLLALGGIDYDRPPRSLDSSAAVAIADARTARTALGVQRGMLAELTRSGGPTFQTLPRSRAEVEASAALFEASFPDAPPAVVLQDDMASKDMLSTLASRARFVHLATHGFFAPDSVTSLGDDRPIDAQLGVGRFDSAQDVVVGMSPLALCGIALTGANLPAGRGSIEGILTGEELASLDLSNCELAILSGCETNAGVARAGSQGLASLREALHAAGVRASLTALWPVGDRAAHELVVDFCRRVWRDKEPPARALWHAKRALRGKRGPAGSYYPFRDWAGWVLTATTAVDARAATTNPR